MTAPRTTSGARRLPPRSLWRSRSTGLLTAHNRGHLPRRRRILSGRRSSHRWWPRCALGDNNRLDVHAWESETLCRPCPATRISRGSRSRTVGIQRHLGYPTHVRWSRAICLDLGSPILCATMATSAARVSDSYPARLRVLVLAPFPPQASGRHGGARAIAGGVRAVASRHQVGVLHLPDSLAGVLTMVS